MALGFRPLDFGIIFLINLDFLRAARTKSPFLDHHTTIARATDDLNRAAFYVLSQNLVHGDALTMRMHDSQPITFAEWGYLGKGKFQRRDFRFDVLTG